MASAYPGALDTLDTTWANTDVTDTVHPAHHADLADAVNKIEAELGTDPSGSFTTVRARVDARLTCRKTADQTISSTTALTNLTDLSLPISTTALDYYFKFVAICTSSAGATNGIRIGLTCPALTGFVCAQVTIPRTIDPNPAAGTAQATPTVTTMPYVGTITSSGDSVVSDIVPVGINFVVVVEGILSNPSATGSIQLQGANEVSTASGNVIKRGSYGEIYIN
jgi:hypothetical protein